jgi:hypothetical protein
LRCCEIVDRYHPRIVYFDWWIQHESVKPWLKKFTAYYYNRSEEWGGGIINYKHDAFPFGIAVPDVERGQFAEVKPFLWQSDTSVMRNSWCYSANPIYKQPIEIIWDLVDGTYDLTGQQTLGYCRIRALDGTAARSARQRDALMQMWNNAKQMSILDLYKMVETAMGFITTDMTKGQCASLMLLLPNMMSYDMHAQQIPVENSFFRSSVNGQGCYFIDYNVNRAYLRGTVYGQEVTEQELKSTLTKMTAELPNF